MNLCIGVNLNPPRRGDGRSVCMKWSYLNCLAAEYSSNFLIKCHDYQWYASLLSSSLPTPSFAGWIPGTKPVRVLFLCLPRFCHWQRQQCLPAQCLATHGSGHLTVLALFACFSCQTYIPVRGALKLKGCSLILLKWLPEKLTHILFFPSPSRSARGWCWRRGWRARRYYTYYTKWGDQQPRREPQSIRG